MLKINLWNIQTKNHLHAKLTQAEEARRRRRRLARLVMSSATAVAILGRRRRRGSAAYSCVLDYVFSNEEDMISNVEPLDPLGSSDHFGIKWKVNLAAPAEETVVVKLDYGKADYNRLNKQLSDVDWNTIIDSGTVEQSWKNMKEVIRTNVEDCVPVRQKKSDKRKSLPYNRREIRKRNVLWKKYKITERAGDYELYKQQRNIAKNKINRWKEELEQKVVLSLNRDKKKFYSYVRN